MSPRCALLRHRKGWTTLSRGGIARPQKSSQRTARPALQPPVDGNDSDGRRLPCLSGASATSSLLVEEALATCSLHLTFVSGALVKKMLSSAMGLLVGGLLLASNSSMLVKEPLAAGSLFLAGASGLLDEECLILIRPQIVNDHLPIPVCAVRASASPMKNGPPTWPGGSNPADCWSSRMAR